MMESTRKINVKILALTLILAILLIAGGVTIKLVGNISSGSTNNKNTYGPYNVTLNNDITKYCNYGDQFAFNFTPTSTGWYYIYGTSLTLDSVKSNVRNNVTWYDYSTTSYNDIYMVYLYSKETYTFNTTAQSTTVVFEIKDK